MLRNVVDAYVASTTERQLDLPLLLLLRSMGYHDVHLTHGSAEFGKDIIAKRREDGETVQVVVQSKAGAVDQVGWRKVQRLIFEAAVNTLAHPSFDAGLSRQVILVTSGELRGNARLGVQNLNDGLLRDLGRPPVECWGGQTLADLFVEHGLSGIHRATSEGFVDHGRFFLAYGRALQGTLTDRDVEAYSRQWADSAIPLDRRLLRAAVEAEIRAQRCAEQGNYWEAVTAHLGLVRILCAAAYTDPETDLEEAFDDALLRLRGLCLGFIDEILEAWEPRRDLLATPFGPLDMTTYLVSCARIAEVASLAYLTAQDDRDREESLAFLDAFVGAEPGCAHRPSDRYAVSVVLTVLALLDGGRREAASAMIRRATVWVCDRHQQGMGLAAFHADEHEETRVRLEDPFAFVALTQRRDSFLAAMCDLAAYTGDPDLFEDVVNDVKSCRIVPRYHQARRTVRTCSIEGSDVLVYAAVVYKDRWSPFRGFRFGNHMAEECATFRFADALDPTAAIALTSLLRDRYFPKLWPQLTPRFIPRRR